MLMNFVIFLVISNVCYLFLIFIVLLKMIFGMMILVCFSFLIIVILWIIVGWLNG